MRNNQVSIFIERFNESVPEHYPADVQRIHVYCDDFDSVFAALSKAYAMAVNALGQYEPIGVRADVSTNEFSRANYREMHGAIPEYKPRYEDDTNLEYRDTIIQLHSDLIWAHEHSGEIIDTIRGCKDEEEMKAALKERFGLNDYQVRKLSQIRFDMLTQGEYQASKDELEQMDSLGNREEAHAKYMESKRKELSREIKKLEAYFTAADHCEEILKLILDVEEQREFEKIMEERFGFSREESRMIRYLSIHDFSVREREQKREQLERLRKNFDSCL